MGRIIAISHSQPVAFPVRVVTGTICTLVRFCISLQVLTSNTFRPLFPPPPPEFTVLRCLPFFEASAFLTQLS
jgi:hypothetical protein